MQPVVTVAEMRAADAVAQQAVPESELVQRAGFAVASEALAMLGGPYGRRVVVLAGKGNNGNDGRVAASVLARRGASVAVIDTASAPKRIDPCDLVIDAAYGTGFAGTYEAPEVDAATPVLAVDIPSGVDGDTGVVSGRALAATTTVTFAALKPGLLMGAGRVLSGRIRVADIGVVLDHPSIGLVEDADVDCLPRRPLETHKWANAVVVVAGSPGMEGAAYLCARGASRAGAGMVRLAVPGADPGAGGPWPLEAVRMPLAATGWADDVLDTLERCKAIVIGPGLGRHDATIEAVRRVIERSPVPVVVDADGLFALGSAAEARGVVAGTRPVVLTPHDGEYRRLAGDVPGPDRVAAARRLAESTGAVVLVKGSLTAVGVPPGSTEHAGPSVLLAGAGTPALATAGTGDVLGGVIAACIARGVDAPKAAALAAHVHGSAAQRGRSEGLVSVDLPELVADWLTSIRGRHD